MQKEFIITSIHRIILVGKNEYPKKTLHFYPELEYNELIFHLSGNASVNFDSDTFSTAAGTVRFLPKGKAKHYSVNRFNPGECIDIYFETDSPISKKAFTVDMSHSKKLPMLFKKAFSVWVAKDDGYYFRSLSLVYEILAELLRDNYIPEEKYNVIKPAIKYIKENFYKEDITIQKLSSVCGISYSYLKQIFTKKFGVPPKKYINQLKMNYACELLAEKNISVTNIAKMCGFPDVCFFSKQFKKYMGVSPTTFRKNNISSK